VTVISLGRFRFLFSALLAGLSLMLIPALAAGQGIPLNQALSSPNVVYQNSVSMAYPASQQAGGLNVVIVGWNDSTSTITSVQDTNGNTYVLAAGVMDITNPDVSQAIYFASNINAGRNTVTVTFNAYIGAQDVRLLEYGGPPFLENTTNPLDTSVGSTGNVSPAATGTMTTTYANDVLDVSGTIDTGFTNIIKICGTGCSLFAELPPLAPFFDISADALVATTGAYQGQADTAGGGGGNWVFQGIALRVAGQTTVVNPAPTATLVSPATSPETGGVPIAITGTGFLPGATVTITGTLPGAAGVLTVSAVNCVVASSILINCVTPVYSTIATAGPSVVVTNPDLQATAPLAFSYTSIAPFTTLGGGNFSPTGGNSNGGSLINITGSDFASGATVTIGGTRADVIAVLNSTTITATTPAGSVGAQNIVVTNPSGQNASPGGYTYSAGAGINFVQSNSAQPTGTGQPSAPFNLPQAAGDLNVVVIGWGDTTSTIQTVSDNAGNTYSLAVAPTQGAGLTQALYYAKNINASATNTVTVQFNGVPTSPDLRIVEYSGVDTANPFDGGAGASGTGSFLDSGPVSPTGVGDIILGAGTAGGAITPARGKACADSSCVYTTAVFTRGGNNVEHTFPTVAGPFDATAFQSPATDPWVMQVAAFKLAGAAVANFTVTATALSPASVTAGSSAASTVTVTPSGGFSSAVALTCTGLPTGGACVFVPASVTPGASAATSALTITTTSGTPAGTSPVTITGTSGSLTVTTTVTLVVTAATGGGNFTLTATPAAQTVSPGGAGTSTINVVPTGGFTGTVAFSCAVAPSPSLAPVCSVAPASATTTATLNVTTTAATASLQHSSSIFYAMFLPLAGMTLLGVSFGSRRRKVLGILLVFLTVSGLLFLASCGGSSSGGGGGGGNPGTPAGAYTITVTGTSGALAAETTTFTLTVN
jgi:hypothetical protein